MIDNGDPAATPLDPLGPFAPSALVAIPIPPSLEDGIMLPPASNPFVVADRDVSPAGSLALEPLKNFEVAGLDGTMGDEEAGTRMDSGDGGDGGGTGMAVVAPPPPIRLVFSAASASSYHRRVSASASRLVVAGQRTKG